MEPKPGSGVAGRGRGRWYAVTLVALAGVAASIVLVSRHHPNAATTASSSTPSASTAPASPCPLDMTQVGDSCVDRYEGSLVERLANGSEEPFSPYMTPEGRDVRAVSLPSTVPQAYISLVQAKRACAASNKRVCRSDEWTRACRGPSATRFPYGDKRIPGVCNDAGHAPVPQLYFGSAMYEHEAMNDPRLNQLPDTVRKTGEASGCTNAFGAFDMVGNLHEWLDDGTFHGGYYLDVTINREGCDYTTVLHEADYHDYSTGFRCCKDAARDSMK